MSYSPNLGRWLQPDPIEIEGGDANFYRFVENNPSTFTDPSGLFKYDVVSGPVFHGQNQPIGYEKLRLDIIYPAGGKGGTPARGSFVQVNTITTIVVTCKDGKLQSTPTVLYIADRAKLLVGTTRFNDTLSGPKFDKNLKPDAILVVSFVKKEHGFTTENVKNITGSTYISEDEADKYRKSFDKN